jgi:YebC/PmpR family DNA-binding regulatory protein
MAGHSKYKNIQFRKDRQDRIRSKLFSKLSRDITIAAKHGGLDPTANSRLRLAIANAKAESASKDMIDRAIKKASGGEADLMEEIRYEGFAPGGVGLIVEVLTDNRNRAAANVRAVFTKHGGNLAETGAVSFMFDRVGEIAYPRDAGSDDEAMEAAIEAGAEDVASDDEGHLVTAAFEDLGAVAEALEARLGPATSTAVTWRPKTEVLVSGDEAQSLVRLIEALEDDDDVQNVFGNYAIEEAELARLSA